MKRNQFFTVTAFIIACLLFTGCASSVVTPPPTVGRDEPYRFVIATFHISGNKITFVTSRVDEGWASDRQKQGEIRIVLYALDHQTVLEEYRIPDPRRGHGPEDLKKGTSLGPMWGDDIDFDIAFPLYADLRYVEVYDPVGELTLTVDLAERLSQ